MALSHEGLAAGLVSLGTVTIALLVEPLAAVLALEELETKVHQLVVKHVALLPEGLEAALESADQLLVVAVGREVPLAPGLKAARHYFIQFTLEIQAVLREDGLLSGRLGHLSNFVGSLFEAKKIAECLSKSQVREFLCQQGLDPLVVEWTCSWLWLLYRLGLLGNDGLIRGRVLIFIQNAH